MLLSFHCFDQLRLILKPMSIFATLANCDSNYDRWLYNVLETAKQGLDPPAIVNDKGPGCEDDFRGGGPPGGGGQFAP